MVRISILKIYFYLKNEEDQLLLFPEDLKIQKQKH